VLLALAKGGGGGAGAAAGGGVVQAATPNAGSSSATPTRATKTPGATTTWYHVDLIRAAFRPKARRACVLAASAAAVGLACSGAPAKRVAPLPRHSEAPPPLEPWPPFAETMKLEPVTEQPIRVQGHLNVPPYAVTRVSPGARDAYVTLVTDSKLPADAVVAMTHQVSEAGEPDSTYVMERRSREWRYLVVDAEGRIRNQGRGGCAGCHAGGVAEALFGLPRPKAAPAPRE
jgi:hypothetical protein